MIVTIKQISKKIYNSKEVYLLFFETIFEPIECHFVYMDKSYFNRYLLKYVKDIKPKLKVGDKIEIMKRHKNSNNYIIYKIIPNMENRN